MKPYHPSNLKHQPYGPKRVIILAWIAKLLGIQFKIEGMPYGGAHKHMAFEKIKPRDPASYDRWVS